MRCVRCGVDLPRGTEALVRLAVLAGDPPGPAAWRRDGVPWPHVDLCRSCARAVALVIAESPMHRPGGGPPIEAEELERLRTASW